MRLLQIPDYDYAEQEALRRLGSQDPNAVAGDSNIRLKISSDITACIAGERAINANAYFESFLGAITPNEFDVIQRIVGLSCDLSEEWTGEVSFPQGVVLEDLNLYRAIKYLYEGFYPRVFLPQPGAGYLGAALLFDGYPVGAFESRQRYYLYQHHLWKSALKRAPVFPIEDLEKNVALFQEGVFDTEAPEHRFVGNRDSFHTPWWHYAQWNVKSAPKAELVVLSPDFWRMRPESITNSLKLYREMLSGYGGRRPLIITAGSTRETSRSLSDTLAAFALNGFRLTHADSSVAVFAPNGSADAANAPTPDEIVKRCSALHASALIGDTGIRSGAISETIAAARTSFQEVQYVAFSQVYTLFQILANDPDPSKVDDRLMKRAVGQ